MWQFAMQCCKSLKNYVLYFSFLFIKLCDASNPASSALSCYGLTLYSGDMFLFTVIFSFFSFI